MAQKIYISLFISFLLLLTFIFAFIAFFLEPTSSTSLPASDSEFPMIYVTLVVLAGLGILAAILVRLRR